MKLGDRVGGGRDDAPPEEASAAVGEAEAAARARAVIRDPETGVEVPFDDTDGVRRLVLGQLERHREDEGAGLGSSDVDEIAREMIAAGGGIGAAIENLRRVDRASEAVAAAIRGRNPTLAGRGATHRTAIAGQTLLEELKKQTFDKAQDLLPRFVDMIEETNGYEPQSVTLSIRYKPGGSDRDPVITIAGKLAGGTRATVRYVKLKEPDEIDELSGEIRPTGRPLQLCMFID